jgi:hypothetical protein
MSQSPGHHPPNHFPVKTEESLHAPVDRDRTFSALAREGSFVGRLSVYTLIVFLVALSIAVPTNIAMTATSGRLAETNGAVIHISTDGTWAVWEDDANESEWADVFAADVRGGSVLRVNDSDPDTHHHSPDVSGGIVVWTEEKPALDDGLNSKIRGRAIDTGSTFTISDSVSRNFRPVIDGKWVSWLNNSGAVTESGERVFSVMLRNVRTMDAEIEIGQVRHPETDLFISDDFVVWSEPQDFSRFPPISVFSYRISTGETRTLLEHHPFRFGVFFSQSRLVYQDQDENQLPFSIVLDIRSATSQKFRIPGTTRSSDGRFVIFETSRIQWDPLNTFSLQALDLESGRILTISRTERSYSAYWAVDARDGTVVWTDDRSIYTADMSKLLHAAPFQNPANHLHTGSTILRPATI